MFDCHVPAGHLFVGGRQMKCKVIVLAIWVLLRLVKVRYFIGEDKLEEKLRSFIWSYWLCKSAMNYACSHCRKCWAVALVLCRAECSKRCVWSQWSVSHIHLLLHPDIHRYKRKPIVAFMHVFLNILLNTAPVRLPNTSYNVNRHNSLLTYIINTTIWMTLLFLLTYIPL